MTLILKMVKSGDSAKMLYLGIPEIERGILETYLLKTYRSATINASEIMRLFVNNPYPSIFLFQTGHGASKRVFGGYANESWGNDGNFFGGPSSFLFLISMTEKVKLRENPNPPNDKQVFMWHNNHSLSFGIKDLILTEEVD